MAQGIDIEPLKHNPSSNQLGDPALSCQVQELLGKSTAAPCTPVRELPPLTPIKQADSGAQDQHIPGLSIKAEPSISGMAVVDKAHLIQDTFDKLAKTDDSYSLSRDQFNGAVKADWNNLSPNQQKAASFIQNHFDQFEHLTISHSTVASGGMDELIRDTENPSGTLWWNIGGFSAGLAGVATSPFTLKSSPKMAAVQFGLGALALYDGAKDMGEHHVAMQIDASLSTDLK